MADVIGIRDDMYIGKGNAYMHEVVDSVTQGYKDGILEQKPTLVNLQCDIDHPTQCMADMLHIIHEFGGVENLKGKKAGYDMGLLSFLRQTIICSSGCYRSDDPYGHGSCSGSSRRL